LIAIVASDNPKRLCRPSIALAVTQPPTISRFAPSPTGLLHLGHAFSALFAERAARESGGRFILRIEDIDETRCRPEFTKAIFDDLHWLGLNWQEPVRRQSDHRKFYASGVEILAGMGLLYPCTCTRKDIAASASAPHAPAGPDGPLYPGTCRTRTMDDSARLQRDKIPFALRLNMARALSGVPALSFTDRARGTQSATPEIFGDIVIARKEFPASYHLAVVMDDALQGVTLVTRGEDLFAATHVQRLLQHLLELPTQLYHHHELVRDAAGARLAKRDAAPSLQSLRASGRTAQSIRQELGFA